jgi:parallel beta helix pectate lyase-like protein
VLERALWIPNPGTAHLLQRKAIHEGLLRHFFVTALILSPFASYAQPATTITSIPFFITQPGKYILQSDLTTLSSNDGISVGASGVTIDLNGFSIISTARPNSAAGVRASGVTDVRILNGVISGFAVAIDINNLPSATGSGYLIDNVRASVLDEGIIYRGCKDSVIQNCTISKDNLSRFGDAAGIRLFRCRGIRVLKNTVTAGASSFVRYPVGISPELRMAAISRMTM